MQFQECEGPSGSKGKEEEETHINSHIARVMHTDFTRENCCKLRCIHTVEDVNYEEGFFFFYKLYLSRVHVGATSEGQWHIDLRCHG